VYQVPLACGSLTMADASDAQQLRVASRTKSSQYYINHIYP
jgi:hypothetical protein